MQRYKITIWKWQEELHSGEYEFKNSKDAYNFALGLYEGFRLTSGATGYKEVKLQPRYKLVQSDEFAGVLTEMCEHLYNEGPSKVYDYANKTKMPYSDCKPCEASTPTIISKDFDTCGLCGGQKEKQEFYIK
jgi:hypothetical protein